MAANDYYFVDKWRVNGTLDEVSEIMRHGEDFDRWWPSVYRESREIVQGDAQGHGKVVTFLSHAMLPYDIRWQAATLETNHPYGYTIRAMGDFEGTGTWRFAQDGEWVNMTYEWTITATKPLLRYGSFIMKPLYGANHHWAMRMGEQSLQMELARRRAQTPEERNRIPPPPGAPPLLPRRRLVRLLGIAAGGSGAALLLRRKGYKVPLARTLGLAGLGAGTALGVRVLTEQARQNTTGAGYPPGPPGYPLLGILPDLRRDPLKLAAEIAPPYGNVVSLSLGPSRAYLLNHPAAARHVLEEYQTNYVKSKGFKGLADSMRMVMGEGLNVSEGPFWRRQRFLVDQALHHGDVEHFARIISDHTAQMLRRWDASARAHQPVEVEAEMIHLTLDILMEIIFGSDIAGEAGPLARNIIEALEYVDDRLIGMIPLPPTLPTRANRRYAESIRTIDEIVYRMIKARRESDRRGDDLLSLLMDARNEQTGETMNDRELRDEVMTVFTAGYPPEAFVLTWVWYFLSQNPAAEAKLHAELSTVLGDRPPTIANMDRLPYTRMVLQEAARLCPPNWGIFRTAVAEDEIGGYRIPAGAEVIVNSYYINRHPDFWDNPQTFDPARFVPERSAGRPAEAYLAFNIGPRACLGKDFALMEGVLIAGAVAQQYRLRQVPGHAAEPQAAATFIVRPPHGLLVTLESRNSA